MRASGSIAVVAAIAGAFVCANGCEKVIGADFGAAQLATCTRESPPAAPTVTGAGGSVEIVAATYSVDLGEGKVADGSAKWRTQGFDEDGVCTSVGDPPRCHAQSWTTPLGADGTNGIDNALGQLIDGQVAAFGQVVLHTSDVSATIQSGAQPPLVVIQLRDYDGLADDDDVQVTTYLTSTIPSPKWDGSDVFPLLEESFEGGAPVSDAGVGDASSDADATSDGGAPGAPRWVTHGYVSHYHVVARYPRSALRMLGVVLHLSPLTLVGTLSPTPGVTPQQWELHDAMLAGVFPEQEIVTEFPELSNAVLGVTVCTNDPNWKNIKRFLCSYSDSLVSSPAGVCDGISYGVRFDARRVKLGPVVPRVVLTRCAPDLDPASTTCTTPP